MSRWVKTLRTFKESNNKSDKNKSIRDTQI